MYKPTTNFRVGYGYDAHRFAPGRKLILGGTEIPYHLGLDGHSDADVLVHAVCDALLGALALGDIGKHFPDTDPAYKGIDSLLLLRKTVELLAAKGYRVGNIDATVRMQKPKMAAYVPAMQGKLAETAGIEPDQISIKATTTEGMGFEGLGEGVSASAVALVWR